jgi:hypothetical protein
VREEARELMTRLDLGVALVSLSVPISGEPVLRVRVTHKPDHSRSEIRLQTMGGEELIIPLELIESLPVRALGNGG